MKPYLAVLYDSLLESLSSRVLWMLLAAWTLLIGVLFPLTLSSTESYRIRNRSFSSSGSAKSIMDSLADASAGKGSRAVQAVYSRLDEDFQSLLKQRKETNRRITIGALLEELNRLLTIEDLYDAEAWPTAAKRSEIQGLLEKENRTPKELERLNRKLLNLTFPNRLNYADGQATQVTWAGLAVGSPMHISVEAARPIVERMAFPLVMRVGLGIIAMLIAIIITSPMIPDMFQTGSLHLLLSKPISRSLLFLTKFLGGCIFVAINIIYLLVGLYLYAGIRLQIWNSGILWCIPLFVFVFMVYYSVSALVGVIWKNPIVSVVVTAVFWAVCFGVGTLHLIYSFAVNVQPQATRVVPIHETIVIGNAQGRILFWDPSKSVWQLAYGDVDGMQLLGPIWSEGTKNLYFSRLIDDPFGIVRTSGEKLEFARLPDLADAADKTFRSKPWADGRLDSGPVLPLNSVQFLPWQDSFALFNQDGFYVFDVTKTGDDKSQYPRVAAMLDSWLKQEKDRDDAYVPVLQNLELAAPFDLNVSSSTQTIAAVSNGEVRAWKTKDEKMQSIGSVALELDTGTVCLVACNDRIAMVCPNGGAPIIVDLEGMKVRNRLAEIGNSPAKQVRTSADGSFAFLNQQGHLWVVDSEGATAERLPIRFQGDVAAIEFGSSGELWIAHHVNQIDRWNIASKKSTLEIRPSRTWFEWTYQYIVNPFYLANPKPASVSQTINYLLTPTSKQVVALNRLDMERPQIEMDPWQPIWSNALFVALMLTLSCWYLYRQDL